MKRIAALALSFGLMTAAAASVNAASLLTDQVLLKKPSQETGAQTLRGMIVVKPKDGPMPQKRP